MARNRVSVPVSTARAKLFKLAEMVRESADDTVVVLEQRGQREQVALVRESRLAYLETRVGELDAIQQRQKPFTLAGSLSSSLDDDDLDQVLAGIRKEWSGTSAPHSRQAAPPRRRTRPRR